jgi:hypothetical protein
VRDGPTPLEDVHCVHHDVDGEEALSDRPVAAVADLADANPSERPSLEARIDVAALDALWETVDDGPARLSAGCLTFSYGGYVVVVRSTGAVFLGEVARE